MAAKFNFYERVKVLRELKDVNGSYIKNPHGYIIGIAEEDDGTGYYTVSLYANINTCCLDEEDLESLGDFETPEPFSGNAKVLVDDKGQGHLIDIEIHNDETKNEE